MTESRRRATRLGLVLLAVSAITVTACGGDDDEAAKAGAGKAVTKLDAEFIPKELLGLSVEAEPTPSGLADVQRSYLGAVALYSLRRGDLLQATLQVGRFRNGVEYSDRKFRESLLTQIGASRPQRAWLGDEIVYLTTGLKQRLAIWFRGDHILILGTREELDRPRTLLREAMELQP